MPKKYIYQQILRIAAFTTFAERNTTLTLEEESL